MPTNIASGPKLALCLLMAAGLACNDNGDVENGGGSTTNQQTSETCERDDASDPADALAYTPGDVQQGYICPIGDVDWYAFSIGDDETIAEVSLRMSTGLSPVELAYTVYRDAGGQLGEVMARTDLSAVGQIRLDSVECLEPGDYLMNVRDFHESSQDPLHHYEFEIHTRTDPDTNEPNRSMAQATDLPDGVATQGYISCVGDEDWFAFEATDTGLLEVLIEAPPVDFQIHVEVFDAEGESITTFGNPSSPSQDTDLERIISVPEAGTYYLVVSDSDGRASDLENAYQITARLIEDIDPNEPNNTPAQATPLSDTPINCGADWSETLSTWGTISAPGDVDWFRIPIEGCDHGIIEAEMVFDTGSMSNAEKWELAQTLQAELVLVRPHDDSPCASNSECTHLELSCSSDLDCAGYNEQCDTSTGTCAAPRACLQEGVCGGIQTRRRYDCPEFLDDCIASVDRSPEPNRALVSAPIFGGDAIYLRAGDFQSQASEPQLRYDLEVRLRDHPGPNEPTHLYTNDVEASLPIARNQAFAHPVEVLDCTGPEPECCADGDTGWTTGTIGYQNDMDWYRYHHPCAEEDCTLAFHYEIDDGPVDTIMNLYTEQSLWYTLVFNDHASSHPAVADILGGLTPDAQCFYASLHHGEGDYYMLVRDRLNLLEDGRTVEESTRDWDPDQHYRFCFEKVSNICEEPPCAINENDNTCDLP